MTADSTSASSLSFSKHLPGFASIALLAAAIFGLARLGFGVVPVWILAVPFILLAYMDFEMRFRQARSVTAQFGMIAFHFVIVATVVAAHQQIGAARDVHAVNALVSRGPAGKTSGCGSGGCGASGSCGSMCGGGQGASGGCGGGCGSGTADAKNTKAKALAMATASAMQGRTGIPTPRPMPTSLPAPAMPLAKPPVSLVPNGLPVPVTNAPGSPSGTNAVRVPATPSGTPAVAAPAGGAPLNANPQPSPETTPPRAPGPQGPAPGAHAGGTPPAVPAPNARHPAGTSVQRLERRRNVEVSWEQSL